MKSPSENSLKPLRGKVKWERVSAKQPCEVCSKGDWCTFSEIWICCMRVKSDRMARNGGWLHEPAIAEQYKEYFTRKLLDRKLQGLQKPKIDFFRMWRTWYEATRPAQLRVLGEGLKLDPMALHLVGAAWAPPHAAWAFPMHDGAGNVCGIRLRNDVRKWAVLGSKQGVFLHHDTATLPYLLVEGPTDSCAALEMGYGVIGRPSCAGCHEIILETLVRCKIRRVIVVADNDTPGRRGAEALQAVLKIPSIILNLPCKDLREFVGLGGTRQVIESMSRDFIWTQPTTK